MSETYDDTSCDACGASREGVPADSWLVVEHGPLWCWYCWKTPMYAHKLDGCMHLNAMLNLVHPVDRFGRSKAKGEA